jgi:nucleoside-diphosphate-sugar epimerase
MGDRVLVTGGAGFIGSNLVRGLLREGSAVVVLDDLSTGSRDNLEEVAGEIEFLEGSILDAQALGPAMAGVERVFHLAAQVSVPASMDDPEYNDAVNCRGTQMVLSEARSAGASRVVYSASCAVYGNAPGLPKDEHATLSPESPYAASKYYGEVLGGVWSRSMGLEVASLRYFNVFGPRQNPLGGYAAAIPIFIRRVLDGAPIVIHGDGEQTRDFVHVDNVVEANLLASRAAGAAGGVFNIGSGVQISINEVVSTIAEVVGVAAKTSYGDPRAGDVRHSVADISHAVDILGYRPSVGLADGLASTIAWYGEQS